MQNNGNISELPLADILQTVQKDRATGTLHLANGDAETTLYFLFGHLFHATSGDRQGEDVVAEALDWGEGTFTFDSKAKLPAEESIKVSTADILSRHGGNGGATTDAEAEPAAADEDEEEVEPVTGQEEEPAVASDAPPEEDSRNPKRRRTDHRPGTRPPETMELYAVPRGKLIYEQLTASFVDFPKVLRSLAKDKHTGYVRLEGDGFSGVLLFASGAVVEAIYEGTGDVETGKDAFDAFAANIDAGEGALDVIELSPEIVTALYQLLTAPSLYEHLMGRFVRADALLEYLNETGASGAVIVRTEKDHGIVLLREGEVLGSYTDKAREVTQKPDKVMALCAEPLAEIEVRGGPVPEALPVMEPHGKGPSEVPTSTAATAPPKAKAAPKPEPAAEAKEEEPARPLVEASPNGVDWSGRIDEMASRADTVLGTRSKKVKELLLATSHSQEDVDATLDRISELSIMFVDPSKLTALADDMRRIAAGAE